MRWSFVDEMYTPHPRPFVDGEHVVVYDNSDPDAFEKLDYYLSHPQEAQKLAAAGLRHALRYHRAVSRLDFILRSAHELRAEESSYTYTAQQIKDDVKATTQAGPYRRYWRRLSGCQVRKCDRERRPEKEAVAAVEGRHPAARCSRNRAHRKSLGFKRRYIHRDSFW